MYMKVIGLLCMKVWKWSCEKPTLGCISHPSNVFLENYFHTKKDQCLKQFVMHTLFPNGNIIMKRNQGCGLKVNICLSFEKHDGHNTWVHSC